MMLKELQGKLPENALIGIDKTEFTLTTSYFSPKIGEAILRYLPGKYKRIGSPEQWIVFDIEKNENYSIRIFFNKKNNMASMLVLLNPIRTHRVQLDSEGKLIVIGSGFLGDENNNHILLPELKFPMTIREVLEEEARIMIDIQNQCKDKFADILSMSLKCNINRSNIRCNMSYIEIATTFIDKNASHYVDDRELGLKLFYNAKIVREKDGWVSASTSNYKQENICIYQKKECSQRIEYRLHKSRILKALKGQKVGDDSVGLANRIMDFIEKRIDQIAEIHYGIPSLKINYEDVYDEVMRVLGTSKCDWIWRKKDAFVTKLLEKKYVRKTTYNEKMIRFLSKPKYRLLHCTMNRKKEVEEVNVKNVKKNKKNKNHTGGIRVLSIQYFIDKFGDFSEVNGQDRFALPFQIKMPKSDIAINNAQTYWRNA